MYKVIYQFTDKDQEAEIFTVRKKALAARNKRVKSGEAIYAELIDLLTNHRYGYGIGPEERLLAAIFNEPLPTEKHYYLDGELIKDLS